MSALPRKRRERGPLAWMVQNRVTPNLLMLFLLLGGLFMTTRIKQEVFPEFDLDMVTVQVAYSGASPEEVERGIVLAVEEAIRGIEGVKEINASAAEGSGTVTAELEEDADQQRVYQDIQQQVDRITTFPDDAEEPQVSLVTRRREVLLIQLYGEVGERALRETAEQVRDRLLQNPGITQVDLAGERDYEILVEVSREQLRAFGLTLGDVAARIDTASEELPGGSLKTTGGDILLRIKDRRDWASEFARIPILTTPEGSVVTLGELAEVREGFEETDRFATFNGGRSIGLDVFRVGEQTPIGVSDAARAAMAEIAADLPEGIDWQISRDSSEVYRQRLELLLKNAFMGLALVLLVLGLFLEFKLAFWVTMGIPISFLGGLLFLPLMGVSINMISMFAFIIALGIVVDDAIIAGENIYEYRQQGMGFAQAAIRGARDVATPIAFSILTNVVAFLPISFVPGMMGKVWAAIPLVVITVFLISWLESLLILPSHLAHTGSRPSSRLGARLHGWQQAFAERFGRFINRVYGPFLDRCLRWRALTVATGLALLLVVLGYALSGRIGMILMPRVESDRAVVTAVLPVGSPLARVTAVQEELVGAMQAVAEQNGSERLLEGIYSEVNENQVEVTAYLTQPGVRPLTTAEVTHLWRERVGPLVGLESLRFQSDRGGPGSGASLTVELSHRDIEVLDRASVALAERLAEFPNVKDVDDGYTPGKQQLDFRIKPEGQSLGLTSSEVARQVRHAFSGVEALKQQRGRNEVTVRVRLPENQRASEFDVEQLMISTPAGTFVPLLEVAEVSRGRAYTTIARRDARRTLTVSADVEPIGETGQVMAALNASVLPGLARDFPGLSYGYEGRQAELAESMRSLVGGFALALLATYFLLAIPFRSYSQPLIVMIAIPFGIVGAVLGHLIMGYNLSLISMMGIVALSGVVVNDSLVLIDYANRRRLGGETPGEAIRAAGVRRFRPIILTTLTTFGGLAPMIFETSRQARFMIPMAISLGFGILFATLIVLVLVPCLYLVVEDLLGWLRLGPASQDEGAVAPAE
ncbi:multidrug resistance protein [Desulfuromonas versatilis]|uniref:Multidrug resistance protein n=1 Tax=Desulfuromonas versatilis TaxID=2802975 RepID=A0ABM8HU51_9BACT|nr:efflux RND transporter permease subunit [Desulfuromonas versatilis]BCR06464.1 multidrug resistance protein [Desulfuromonas versatilis]